MKFPVEIFSKGQSKNAQCAGRGQLSVSEEEGIVLGLPLFSVFYFILFELAWESQPFSFIMSLIKRGLIWSGIC